MKELTKKEFRVLRAKSKKWAPREWEDYLQTLEIKRSENLIHPKNYEKLRNKNLFLQESLDKCKERSSLLSQLKRALNKLTFKQKTVIKMIFWEGLSEREIADKLCLSTSSVRDRKVQALQKLKVHFLGSIPTASPYIGAKKESELFFDALKSISKTQFFESISEPKKGDSHVA